MAAGIRQLAGDRGQRRRFRSCPLLLTAAVLVLDLERPERFHYILTKSNWRSWMVWGAWFLAAHGVLERVVAAAGWFGRDNGSDRAGVAGDRDSRARDVLHGIPVRAGARARSLAGSARRHRLDRAVGRRGSRGAASGRDGDRSGARPALADSRWILAGVSLAAHLVILLFENVLTPSPTRHHGWPCGRSGAVRTRRSSGASQSPPAAYCRWRWSLGAVTGASRGSCHAALLALAGGAAWEYIWVEAGQSVPLS